jgi:hypothetical protein
VFEPEVLRVRLVLGGEVNDEILGGAPRSFVDFFRRLCFTWAVRRSISAVAVVICLVAVFVPGTAANAKNDTSDAGSPLYISPIEAKFFQAFYLTDYWTDILLRGSQVKGSADVKVVWTLDLQLVDKAGTPDPEMTAMGLPSGAAVDRGCTNHGDDKQFETITFNDKSEQLDGDYTEDTHRFAWHHPDAQDSHPVGWYHCNHALQGPHGHQGLITVTVSTGKWQCVADFKGTHTSVPYNGTGVNPNVEDGTASKPLCTKIRY